CLLRHSDRAAEEGGEGAQARGGEEGDVVGAVGGADVARAESGHGGAQLVGGEDPAEDDGGVRAEVVAADGEGGRDGGHPVEAVEDDEDPDAGFGGGGEQRGQGHEGQAAPEVVDHEQDAGIDPVGEPAGQDGAGDVEQADGGQQARGDGGRHAVVVRGGDEMGADQAVGAHAADGEATREQPEGGDAGAAEQAGGSGGEAAVGQRVGFGVGGAAVGAGVAGTVPDEDEHQGEIGRASCRERE